MGTERLRDDSDHLGGHCLHRSRGNGIAWEREDNRFGGENGDPAQTEEAAVAVGLFGLFGFLRVLVCITVPRMGRVPGFVRIAVPRVPVPGLEIFFGMGCLSGRSVLDDLSPMLMPCLVAGTGIHPKRIRRPREEEEGRPEERWEPHSGSMEKHVAS